jgi:iron complex transport system substrate-binding protein
MTYTCGQGSFLDDLIGLAGGRNVVELHERWPAVSAEYIASTAPQVLLTATSCSGPRCDLTTEHKRIETDLAAQSPWNKLPAVRDKRLIVVEADILLRPGPRILEALQQVEAQLAGWSK